MIKLLLPLRLLFGLLALWAIRTQLSIHLHQGFSVVNFFSYFTNLSNLFAAMVLLYGALRQIRRRETSLAYDEWRGISAVNMAVVGIVFAVLLRDVELGALLPWVNFVLHKVIPCVVVLEWMLQPPRKKLGLNRMLLCEVFPAIYLTYTLLRGAKIGWYPYPFLNPANVGGYGEVTAYAAGIALNFLLAAWILFTLGNKLHEHAEQALKIDNRPDLDLNAGG